MRTLLFFENRILYVGRVLVLDFLSTRIYSYWIRRTGNDSKRFPFRVSSLYGPTIFVWDSKTMPFDTNDLCSVRKHMSDGHYDMNIIYLHLVLFFNRVPLNTKC